MIHSSQAGLASFAAPMLTPEMLLAAKADAWDEGFDAGERDYLMHSTFDEPCIPNPYRPVNDEGAV